MPELESRIVFHLKLPDAIDLTLDGDQAGGPVVCQSWLNRADGAGISQRSQSVGRQGEPKGRTRADVAGGR